jgi:hypothetical protein
MAAAPSQRGRPASTSSAADAVPRDDNDDLLKGAEKSGDAAAAAAALPPLKLRESPLFTRAPFILGTELCERLTYYGIAMNIITYLTGELGYSNSTAAALVNIWSGTCYLTPLLGALVADAWLGRCWTILSFCLVYLAGVVLLTLNAGVTALSMTWLFWVAMCALGCRRPRRVGDAPAAAPLFTILPPASPPTCRYCVALGTGGIKPCVSAFGADQFDETDPRQASIKTIEEALWISYSCASSHVSFFFLFPRLFRSFSSRATTTTSMRSWCVVEPRGAVVLEATRTSET